MCNLSAPIIVLAVSANFILVGWLLRRAWLARQEWWDHHTQYHTVDSERWR